MKRDIDKIIEILTQQFPTLRVVQMEKYHPADDDGLWWFRLSGKTKDIQIESSAGTCPFIIESSDDKSSADATTGNTIEEVVQKVAAYLAFLQKEPQRH